MTSLLEVGLMNAAMATGLAIVVWLATRVWRHPMFVHTLWIVVLLKLITPPLVSVSWPGFETKPPSESAGVLSGSTGSLTEHVTSVAAHNSDWLRSIEEAPFTIAPIKATANVFTQPHESVLLAPSQNEATRVPTQVQGWLSTVFPITWTTAVIAFWLTGTAVYLFLSSVRLVRFHRALSHTVPAPVEVQQIAAELAARFGITNRYRLRVTEGQLAPLVWPIGTPTILMPQRLLAELSAEEVETLLAHEFAHLCRRDHWLRWLELVVTAIYWWHPVVWWAKAAIQRAEEYVCDAWVVARFAGASAPYASALFKAVQFASADRQAAPVMASALGGRDLKERIEHIMNATWKPRLFLPVRLSVLAVAMLILPLSLRAADEEDNSTQPVVAEIEAIEDENTATNQEAAAATDGGADAISETIGSTVAESADAATTDPLGLLITEGESSAVTTANPFAAQPAAGSQPEMQPRRVSVPADPYHIAAGDVLFVSVVAGNAVRPEIDGDFVVEPSGSIALGPQYGRAKIGGLSLEDAEKAVAAHLKRTLREPMVQITIGGWRNEVTVVPSLAELV